MCRCGANALIRKEKTETFWHFEVRFEPGFRFKVNTGNKQHDLKTNCSLNSILEADFQVQDKSMLLCYCLCEVVWDLDY